jgi:hypothetical protein
MWELHFVIKYIVVLDTAVAIVLEELLFVSAVRVITWAIIIIVIVIKGVATTAI